jgi:beta,beta-carotene 9',10'-dioxygenase
MVDRAERARSGREGAAASGTSRFALGFSTLQDEITVDRLPVTGRLPEWLAGTLVRNGPALFDTRGRSFRHWFDGQAMLHRFGFAGGEVSYANRYLDTPSYRSVRDRGRIGYGEFATDPCSSIFSRFFTRFRRKPSWNANVNVTRIGDRSLAVTETTLAVEFDPETLATAGVLDYGRDLGAQTTTAHPHQDPRTGDVINYALRFGRRSEYKIYRQRGGSARELIGSVPADRPGYLHSFAITEDHVALAIYPFVVNPLALVLSGRPFIENYRWKPELGTRIVVLNLRDGSIRGDYHTDPFFAFHHINAWEADGQLVMDLCRYDDARVIDALYLDRLRANAGVPNATPTRYRIDLDGGAGGVRAQPLAEEGFELPRIGYGRHNGRDYGVAYGAGARGRTEDDFLNQLVRVDVRTGEAKTWHEPGCYPGEPVFVDAPAAVAEDDGVVLSVVLDSAAARSFLVVLDARSFTELARAEVPHPIPFGFHGQFGRSGRAVAAAADDPPGRP